jgi:hypothetical protein
VSRLLFAVLLAAGAVACVGAAGARRAYLEAHPEIDPQIRGRIERGEVAPGMTAEQVTAALGEPDSRRSFEEGSGRLEIWTYPGALVTRRITRTVNDLDYRVRLVLRNGVLERIEDM